MVEGASLSPAVLSGHVQSKRAVIAACFFGSANTPYRYKMYYNQLRKSNYVSCTDHLQQHESRLTLDPNVSAIQQLGAGDSTCVQLS